MSKASPLIRPEIDYQLELDGTAKLHNQEIVGRQPCLRNLCGVGSS